MLSGQTHTVYIFLLLIVKAIIVKLLFYLQLQLNIEIDIFRV